MRFSHEITPRFYFAPSFGGVSSINKEISLRSRFLSNSNYGFHLAGPWGLFLKAAKNCFILLNGSVALKFVIGQPQRIVSIATDAFSACSEPLFKATGALNKSR